MSFPSKYAGRCVRCNKRIEVGALIEYDRATKSAWHVGCPVQEEMPQEGQEPEELMALTAPPVQTGRPVGSRKGGSKRAVTVVERRTVVVCCRCGGNSSTGEAMLHKRCIDRDDLDVPF